MSGISWTFAPYAWYTLLVPGIAFFAIYRVLSAQRMVRALAGRRVKALITGFSLLKNCVRVTCLILGTMALAVALFQPRWGFEEELVQQEGRDLLVALDISKSMLAQDYDESRLDLAKQVIKQMLAKLSCERVGLLLFASSAWVQCPLTEDYDAVHNFVDMIDYDSVSSGSTDIAAPITKALEVYEAMPTKKNKLLVLLTDGEDLAGNRNYIQQRARDAGLAIFVIGMGTADGAPIPCYDEHGKPTGHMQHPDGSIVISRLCADALQELVTDVGGRYIPHDGNNSHINTLISMVNQYEKEQYQEHAVHQKRLQYPWFLGTALLFLGMEFLL